MLIIEIPEDERWDELNQEFVYGNAVTLKLEHSLVSVAKWEANWKVPFMNNESMSNEQIIDYIKCMTITQNVPDEVYQRLTDKNFEDVTKYIESPMTATWFSNIEEKSKINSEQITAELIYYWMITLQIPFECQKWHLNRLLTLIRVCIIKNQPPKKMSKTDLANRRRLNEERRRAMRSKG